MTDDLTGFRLEFTLLHNEAGMTISSLTLRQARHETSTGSVSPPRPLGERVRVRGIALSLSNPARRGTQHERRVEGFNVHRSWLLLRYFGFASAMILFNSFSTHSAAFFGSSFFKVTLWIASGMTFDPRMACQ